MAPADIQKTQKREYKSTTERIKVMTNNTLKKLDHTKQVVGQLKILQSFLTGIDSTEARKLVDETAEVLQQFHKAQS